MNLKRNIKIGFQIIQMDIKILQTSQNGIQMRISLKE